MRIEDREVAAYLDVYRCILEKMICKMTSAELTDSISYNFIVQMIPHHKAAIEMSENVLRYIENTDLKRIAEGIIVEQTRSIENMCDIVEGCRRVTNCKQDLCRYQCEMREIMQVMFCRMRQAKETDSIACNFMWEMIPHHEGAVEMSKTTLSNCICPCLSPILKNIIMSQERGIRQMKELQYRLCC